MVSARRVAVRRLRARTGGHTERLRARRRAARARLVAVLGIFGIFLVVLVFIGLWQPRVRVVHITIPSGGTTVQVVRSALSGTYFGVVPRDSIFFFSAARVRAAVLAANPTIAAVSVARTGFNSILVTPDHRTALARWCGRAATSTPADTLAQDVLQSGAGSCYFFDSTGFLYASSAQAVGSVPISHISTSSVSTSSSTHTVALAHAGVSSTSATAPQNDTPLVPYLVYAPLTASSSPPFLNTVANVTKLSALFDFARHLRTFGAQVAAAVIRGDEADLFLSDGTRVTYVLGDEQNADALLVAVKNKISLTDGSLVYVDLRFPHKVYFLKRGARRK